MRAVVIPSFDGPSALQLADVPAPQAAPGTVVIDVAAAAIGPWDAAGSQGYFLPMGANAQLPQIAGWDAAGTVSAIGAGATGFSIGDRVVGFVPQPWMGVGVFAEKAAMPASMLAHVPDGVELRTAATLPVAILTADQTLAAAAVGPGDTLLILGAAGAVGGYITQLAARAGVTVVASVSARDAEEATRLGAAHTINYAGDVAGDTIEAVGSTVTAIADLVGPAARPSAMAALAADGHFVTTIPGATPEVPDTVTSTVISLEPDSARLTELVGLINDGTIIARSGESYGFDRVGQAFAAAARAGGHKITLVPSM